MLFSFGSLSSFRSSISHHNLLVALFAIVSLFHGLALVISPIHSYSFATFVHRVFLRWSHYHYHQLPCMPKAHNVYRSHDHMIRMRLSPLCETSTNWTLLFFRHITWKVATLFLYLLNINHRMRLAPKTAHSIEAKALTSGQHEPLGQASSLVFNS